MNKENKNFKKIFIAELVSCFFNKDVASKFAMTEQESKVIFEAFAATKDFNDELNDSTATVDSTLLKLGKKHICASKFEKAFGVQWPL